ncbi:glycosyltransferase family 4 protein [Altericista sp. CCNU0014]|uniref:glycosyltransferase family 4 protein n=1 Tax=Altericista sp. CCNU0014 TaxID=3082949 RepID=UPI00384C4241
MKIKVAYDISFLVKELKRQDHKSGIFRETEELMHALGNKGGIELFLSCICIEKNLIFNSVKFLSCIQKEPTWAKYKHIDVFKSRLGIKSFYEKYYSFNHPEESNIDHNHSLKLAYNKGIFQLISLFDAYQKIDWQSVDIIHSTYHKLPSKKITKKIPRVLTIQDLIPVVKPDLVAPSLNKAFKDTLSSVDLKDDWIICISEHTKQEFCEYTGFPLERTFVTHLAAAKHFHPVKDLEAIDSVRKLYRIPEGNYFLSLATHLAPHKNLIHLIRCFYKLKEEQPNLNVKLVLAGSKHYRLAEIINSIDSSSKLSSSVIFTGYVEDTDLSALYSGSSAFIFPSLYEGFGLPPLEAMQCGTPVITSNVTSLPEVVGDAGLMVNPADEDELCQAMLTVLNDKDLAQELRYKGLIRSKNFSWSKCAADTVEVYKKVLNSR